MLDKTIVFTMKGTLAVISMHDSVREIVIICIFLRFQKFSLPSKEERKNVNNKEIIETNPYRLQYLNNNDY